MIGQIFLRMGEDSCWKILQTITPGIKNKIIMRKAIKPHEHLSVTLRFLATGRVYAALRFSVAISPYILNLVIPNTSA
jgi:hypothetical protein